jgi:hypothetical protein
VIGKNFERYRDPRERGLDLCDFVSLWKAEVFPCCGLGFGCLQSEVIVVLNEKARMDTHRRLHGNHDAPGIPILSYTLDGDASRPW